MGYRSVLSVIAWLCVLTVGYAALRVAIRPFHAHVVLSGSMGERVPVGSLAVSKKRLPSQYTTGDVVVFHAPNKEKELIIHRVVRVEQVVGGTVELHTKGDANTNGDPWTITRGAVLGEVVLVIPWLGSWLRYLAYPTIFFIVAILSFCVLVLPLALHAYRLNQQESS